MALLDKMIKKSSTSTSEKKSKNPVVEVKGEKGDVLFQDIKGFAEAKQKFDEAEALKNHFYSAVKCVAAEQYIEQYKKDRKNPKTVVVKAVTQNSSIAEVMFVPQDKYKNITAETAQKLKETYGANVIEERISIGMREDLFRKNEKQIEAFLKKLNDEDAEEIFQVEQTFKIAKGSVDRILDIAGKKHDCLSVLDNLGVTVMLKSPTVVEEKETKTSKK